MTVQLLLIALACSLEPLPLTGYILTISAAHGVRNGFAFIAGWVLTLVGVITLTLAVTGDSPPAAQTAPTTAVLIAKIALGVGLLAFAWRFHRTSPRVDGARTPPRWMRLLDKLTVPTAAGIAFLLQPWGLVSAAALTVTETSASTTSGVVTLAAFVVVATLSYAVMQGYLVVAPDTSRARLDGLRRWLDTHQPQIVVALAVGIGVLLIVRSAVTLAA